MENWNCDWIKFETMSILKIEIDNKIENWNWKWQCNWKLNIGI